MKYLYVLVLVILIILDVVHAQAQWLDGGRKQTQPMKGNAALFVNDGAMYFYNEDLGMQKSNDNGKTWIDLSDSGLPAPGPGLAKSVNRMSAGNGRIYAGMNFGNGSGMPFYSTDTGETWNIDTLGAPGHALGWSGLPVVSDIYSWGKWLYVKWDGPNLYHIKTFGSPYKQNTYMATGINNPRSVVAKGDTLFVSSSKCYYTIDGGENWVVPQNNNYPSGSGGGLVITDGNRLILFANKAFAQPCYMYYSDDNGNNWTEVDITSVTKQKILNGDYYYPTAAFVKGNRIELAFQQSKFTTPPNVWKSTNLGIEWSRDTLGLPTSFIHNIIHFAYTPDGTLWCVPSLENIYKQKIDGGTTSSVNDVATITVSITPNPVHEDCSVHIPNHTFTSLSIYSVLGEIVYNTSITTEQTEVQLSTNNLTKGFYRVVLHSPLYDASVPVIVE